MKKLLLATAVFCLIGLTGCHKANPNAGEEAILVMKPWIFGHGGVCEKPVTSGLTWCALTTKVYYMDVIPIRYTEKFDDLFSNDNTPLDFETCIVLKVKNGETPKLYENYGMDWYKINIQPIYRNKTRDYVSIYSPFDLISNREVLKHIDSCILNDMRNCVNELNKRSPFPVEVISVTTGAAKPNAGQLNEMNKTAAAIQAAKTQQRVKEMEDARAAAEASRAIADKQYQNTMNLSTEQFIQLKYIEMIANKPDANIDVLVGSGATNMWNVRR